MPTKMGSSKIWNKLLDTFYSQVIINFEIPIYFEPFFSSTPQIII